MNRAKKKPLNTNDMKMGENRVVGRALLNPDGSLVEGADLTFGEEEVTRFQEHEFQIVQHMSKSPMHRNHVAGMAKQMMANQLVAGMIDGGVTGSYLGDYYSAAVAAQIAMDAPADTEKMTFFARNAYLEKVKGHRARLAEFDSQIRTATNPVTVMDLQIQRDNVARQFKQDEALFAQKAEIAARLSEDESFPRAKREMLAVWDGKVPTLDRLLLPAILGELNKAVRIKTRET